MKYTSKTSTPSTRRFPVAWCPICKHTIMYSDIASDKRNVFVFPFFEGFHGKTILCSKCKTMLVIIDKAAIPLGYTVIPIHNSDF